jgi:acetate kinase
MDKRGYDADQLEDLMNHQAGLLGASGFSPDMETLLEQRQREPHPAQANMLAVKGAIQALPVGYIWSVIWASSGSSSALRYSQVC